ncbi:MAG: hypothetical protein O2867_11125 [Bacteroidetes bacterium]|nr:hypothetical protein [Bacteroidota bacterium]
MSVFIGCSEDAPDVDFVAEVSGRYLLRTELAAQIPASASREDSLKRAKVIINSWVKEQVVLNKAKFNISDDRRIDRLLEEYRNDLLIYEYENQLVKQELDTAVTRDEMLAYYKDNEQNFVLKDLVVRMRHIVLPASTEDLIGIKKKFKDYSEKDSLDILEMAKEKALRFIDKPDEWMVLETVLKDIPYEMDEFKRFIRKNDLIDIERNERSYLFFIHEYNLADGVSPFQFEKERIRNTLINQRKLALLEKMRNELFQEALEKGDIKIIEQ